MQLPIDQWQQYGTARQSTPLTNQRSAMHALQHDVCYSKQHSKALQKQTLAPTVNVPNRRNGGETSGLDDVMISLSLLDVPWTPNYLPLFSSYILSDEEIDSYIQEVPNSGWVCRACDYRSAKIHNITRHVKSRHIAVKDLQCTLCRRHFTTMNNVQMHYKRKHKLSVNMKQISEMMNNYQQKYQ